MSEAAELSALASPESLSELPPRERVFALEAAMKGMDNQLSIPEMTHHYLAGGVYVREMRLPAGTVVTGYIHLRDHVVTIIGDVSVYDETGTRRFTGVNIFTSGKRASKERHSRTPPRTSSPPTGSAIRMRPRSSESSASSSPPPIRISTQ